MELLWMRVRVRILWLFLGEILFICQWCCRKSIFFWCCDVICLWDLMVVVMFLRFFFLEGLRKKVHLFVLEPCFLFIRVGLFMMMLLFILWELVSPLLARIWRNICLFEEKCLRKCRFFLSLVYLIRMLSKEIMKTI